jgi:hypothetical protein
MASAREIRRHNREVEEEHREEQEIANEQFEAENIQLSDDFIVFNLDNLSNSRMAFYDDEVVLNEWCRLKLDVEKFFRNILTPAIHSGFVADSAGRPAMGQVQLNHLNQLVDVKALSLLHRRALQLHMDEITLEGSAPFGLFSRLDEILQIRSKVLEALKFCQGSVKQVLWKVAQILPGVQKGDACYDLLNNSISKCISTGLFLRKYRRDCDIEGDCRADSIEEDPRNGKQKGDIIDFRDAKQREDYLNIDCSEFVEPELLAAERFLQEKIRAENAKAQALSGRRLIEARRAGGKISRRQKLGRRNSKNRK